MVSIYQIRDVTVLGERLVECQKLLRCDVHLEPLDSMHMFEVVNQISSNTARGICVAGIVNLR